MAMKKKCMSCGGSTKMKKGGPVSTEGGDNPKYHIYGIPNAGRTDQLGFKKGGSTTSRAVAPGCRGGMVKDASGKCVMERKFKTGGSTFGMLSVKAGIDKNPKPTAADRIAGAKKKIKSTVKKIVKK